MATGVVSIACHFMGLRPIAVALIRVNWIACAEPQAHPAVLPRGRLSVRRRRGRKRALGTRAPLVTEAVANARWLLDFVQDHSPNAPSAHPRQIQPPTLASAG